MGSICSLSLFSSGTSRLSATRLTACKTAGGVVALPFYFQLPLLITLSKWLCLKSLNYSRSDYPLTSLLYIFGNIILHTESTLGFLYFVLCLPYINSCINSFIPCKMQKTHRTQSIIFKSWDVKQYIYWRFYWGMKHGVCWWLLLSFKYVNGYFKYANGFHLGFLAGRGSQGFDLQFNIISCAPCTMAYCHLSLSPVQ